MRGGRPRERCRLRRGWCDVAVIRPLPAQVSGGVVLCRLEGIVKKMARQRHSEHLILRQLRAFRTRWPRVPHAVLVVHSWLRRKLEILDDMAQAAHRAVADHQQLREAPDRLEALHQEMACLEASEDCAEKLKIEMQDQLEKLSS